MTMAMVALPVRLSVQRQAQYVRFAHQNQNKPVTLSAIDRPDESEKLNKEPQKSKPKLGFLKKWVYLPALTVWSGIAGGYAYQGYQTHQTVTTYRTTKTVLDAEHPHLIERSKALNAEEEGLKRTSFATPEMAAAVFQTKMTDLKDSIAEHFKATGTEQNNVFNDQLNLLQPLNKEQELKTLKILEDLKREKVDYSGAFKAWIKEVNPTQLNQEQLIQLDGKIKQFEQERKAVAGLEANLGKTAISNSVLMVLMLVLSPAVIGFPGMLGYELTQRLKKKQEQSS
jgi:hypothetical protein